MTNQDLEVTKITERLKEHCLCFDCNDGADLHVYVSKFLNVLARIFCWSDKDCSTILKSERQEVVPLVDYEVCCCETYFEFKPYYHKGLDPSSVKFYARIRQGGKRKTVAIDNEKVDYDFVDNSFIINTTQFINPCCPPCEPCETKIEIMAVYEAGYTADTLPACVLDSLCHFFNIFIAYQNNCGSLEDCSKMDRLAIGSVLKSKSVDYLIRHWEVDQESMEVVYNRLINRWALESLSVLSLCNSRPLGCLAIGKYKKCK